MTLVRTTHVRDFDYKPVAPFVVEEISIASTTGSTTPVPTLRQAVETFAKIHIPIRWGWVCSIIDSTDRVVLQYYARNDLDIAPWWGVSEAFEELEHTGVMNEVDLVVAIDLARAAAL